MIRIFLFFITIIAASILAMWFIENDGSITMDWLGYRVQTSVAFAILSTIILITLATIALQLLFWVKSAPQRYKKSFSNKRKEKGLQVLTSGFAAIASGDIRQATKLSKHARNLLDDIPLTKLLEAQTAQLAGDRQLAKLHYTKMLENKDTEIIAIKALLLQAKQDGDLDKAIFLAEKALETHPKASWAMSILIDLYKMTKKWEKAQAITEKAARLKIIERSSANRSLALINIAKCKDDYGDLSSFSARNASKSEDILDITTKEDNKNILQAAAKSYKLLPSFPPIAAQYADILLKKQKKQKAIKILTASWKTKPDPDIAELYMKAYNNESTAKKLKYAQKLLSFSPTDIQSHILVAKAAIADKNYEKAKEHLKFAINISETRSMCLLMAEVEQYAGAMIETIQQWKQRAEIAAPDPTWMCSKCNTQTAKWKVTCGHCDSFDSLIWGGYEQNIHVVSKFAKEELMIE